MQNRIALAIRVSRNKRFYFHFDRYGKSCLRNARHVSKYFLLTPAPPPCRALASPFDSFETLNNDIQFAVIFTTDEDPKDAPEGEEEGGRERVVAEMQRFASHLGPVTGTFHLAGPGRLTLVWDNA